MAKLKKSELVPKSKLGIDPNMFICWNCLFWDTSTGRCPWFEDKLKKKIKGVFNYSFFPYNHTCLNTRLFGKMNEKTKMFLRK